MDNAQLKEIYDGIYKKGSDEHYTKSKYHLTREIHEAIIQNTDWEGKDVMDVGCGAGEFALLLANIGCSSVTGIDYSAEAIEEATDKRQHAVLQFVHKNLFDMSGKFDRIVSLGTLEHMDSPLEGLQKMKNMLRPGGDIIVTVPNLLNPRGYILLTLLYLFDAQVTLADLHYLSPTHFEQWTTQLGMNLTWETVNHSWGSGEVAVADLRERLPKVATSSNLDINDQQITKLCDWLEHNAIMHHKETDISGAIGIYTLSLPA